MELAGVEEGPCDWHEKDDDEEPVTPTEDEEEEEGEDNDEEEDIAQCVTAAEWPHLGDGACPSAFTTAHDALPNRYSSSRFSFVL